MVLIVVTFVVLWRRKPYHPILLMAIVCTTFVWQDPIMNWAPYAVYNPQLWHWPETWPLVSLSPTVEPFIVIGYVMFYLAPVLPGDLGPAPPPAQQSRRLVRLAAPADLLALLIYVFGFVYDAVQEILLIRTQLYIYSQVIPFGSVFTGTTYQFPLLWESSLVTAVMIPAGVLLYRDDTGRTVAESSANASGPSGPRGARHVRRHVPHLERGLLLPLRRQLRDHPRQRGRDIGGVPVALPRGQGVRPPGFLREGGAARPLFGGHLGRMGDGQSGRPTPPHRERGTLQPA